MTNKQLIETWKIYEGFFSFQQMTVEVKIIDNQLTVAFPGMPPGFEVLMLPQDAPHTFTLQGGPVDGATAVFSLNAQGEANELNVGGEFDLTRSEAPASSDRPSGQGLRAPELVLGAEKEAAFKQLLDEMLEERNGRFIDYQLPYPKHQFLQYVAMQDKVIFHGSKKPDIDKFSTQRTSMELNDRSGRGNLQAIYGTHDGLWPMFFAVVDRHNLIGSIRNGVSYFPDADGKEAAFYNFSINQEMLSKRPWSPGTMYFLSRETFRRLPITDGAMSNEWASEAPLTPLAKLALEPEDFPFLDQIGGHDDSELLRASELSKLVTAAVLAFEANEGSLRMQLDWQDEFGATLLEFIAVQQKFVPMAALALKFEADGGDVWLEIDGPPAYLQVLKDQIEDQLSKEN